MSEVRVIPVEGLPEIEAGAPLAELITSRAELRDGDVLVVSQKVVSKAEGRIRELSSVSPGAEARRLATELDKDPALVELILRESRRVLRAERGVLIAETRHGFVCANAGVDSSNLPGEGTVCLLPENPDASARTLRAEVTAAIVRGGGAGLDGHSARSASGGSRSSSPPTIGVVIADSFGRAWRIGQVEVAIGCAGLTPLDDWRGRTDATGRELSATLIAVADEAAAVADLVRGKDSRVPAAIVRGLDRFVCREDGPGAAVLRRPPADDLFR